MQNFQRFNTDVSLPAGVKVAVIAVAIKAILDEKDISQEDFIRAGGTIEIPNRETFISLTEKEGGNGFHFVIQVLGHGIHDACTEACLLLEAIAVGSFQALFEDDDENSEWDQFYNDPSGDYEFEARISEAVDLLSGVIPGVGEVLPDFLRGLERAKSE